MKTNIHTSNNSQRSLDLFKLRIGGGVSDALMPVRTLLHTLLGLFLCMASTLQAQQWCPSGAEWSFNYSYVDWSPGSNGETHNGVLLVHYTGDTMVGGHVAQRIDQTLHYQVLETGEQFSETWDTGYTRYAEDVVYRWDPWSQQYDTLLWFAAVPGDQWPVVGLPDEYQFVVMDTATVNVGGVTLRRSTVQVHWMEEAIGPPNIVHERIGFDVFYLLEPGGFLADGFHLDLLCYRDDDLAYPDPGPPNCGFTTSIMEIVMPPSLSIHPNPGSGVFWIERPEGMRGAGTVRVHDARGVSVGTWMMNSDTLRVDTEQWPSGLYLIEATTDGERRRATAKWVKE